MLTSVCDEKADTEHHTEQNLPPIMKYSCGSIMLLDYFSSAGTETVFRVERKMNRAKYRAKLEKKKKNRS